jgi:hypothetical protein
MSLGDHFLDSHSDFFRENLGAVSDKHREPFTRKFPTWKKATKASGDPVFWLLIVAHLEVTFHGQNIT